MTQTTSKVVIGDGFDKTLKLHFFQTGGHMRCLYEASSKNRPLIPKGNRQRYTGAVAGGPVGRARDAFSPGFDCIKSIVLNKTFKAVI
jgi:hypothetical protein